MDNITVQDKKYFLEPCLEQPLAHMLASIESGAEPNMERVWAELNMELVKNKILNMFIRVLQRPIFLETTRGKPGTLLITPTCSILAQKMVQKLSLGG